MKRLQGMFHQHPHIVTPQTTSTLQEILPQLKVVILRKHNFISALLIMAGSKVSLHYKSVIQLISGCPMVITTGELETGKSTPIKVTVALTGTCILLYMYKPELCTCTCMCMLLCTYLYIHISTQVHARHSIYVKGTNAFFLERASVSSLPFAIDDPPQSNNKSCVNRLMAETANLKAGSLQPLYQSVWWRSNDPKQKLKYISNCSTPFCAWLPTAHPGSPYQGGSESSWASILYTSVLNYEVETGARWSTWETATSRVFHVRTLRRWHSLLCAHRSKKKIQEKDISQLADYQSLLSCSRMRKHAHVGLLVSEYRVWFHGVSRTRMICQCQ